MIIKIHIHNVYSYSSHIWNAILNEEDIKVPGSRLCHFLEPHYMALSSDDGHMLIIVTKISDWTWIIFLIVESATPDLNITERSQPFQLCWVHCLGAFPSIIYFYLAPGRRRWASPPSWSVLWTFAPTGRFKGCLKRSRFAPGWPTFRMHVSL